MWHSVREFNDKMGKHAKGSLKRYPWPGKARELRNLIEHAMIVSTREKLMVESSKPALPLGRRDAEAPGRWPRRDRGREKSVFAGSPVQRAVGAVLDAPVPVLARQRREARFVGLAGAQAGDDPGGFDLLATALEFAVASGGCPGCL